MSKQGTKRRCHSMDFKYQAILEVEKGLKPRPLIEKELNISHSTLCDWLKNAENIKNGYHKYGPSRNRMKTSRWDEIEMALLKWYSCARDQGAIVSGQDIMQKANEFAQKLEITDFEAKDGWLIRFKNRHKILYKNPSDCVEPHWQCILQTLLKEYEPEQIYNADETGIFFKMLPDKMSEMKKISCHRGERSTERLTVLVAANMSGSHKLPLLVVGKYAKPRCFQAIRTLPTNYADNNNTWMTAEIFAEWLEEIDRQMVRQKKKIAMIIDNSPAHSNLAKLDNVKLVFLPPTTTSKVQPMAQGVIKRLKVNYRKKVLVRYIQAKESKCELKLSVLDALSLLSEAWQSVTPTTISNSFRQSGFVTPMKDENAAVTAAKSSFTGVTHPDERHEDKDIDDTFMDSLAAMENHVLLNEFVEFSEDIYTSPGVSIEDIVTEVIDTRKTESAEPFVENDTDTSEIIVPTNDNEVIDSVKTEPAELAAGYDTDSYGVNVPTSDEALECVRKLQCYFQSKEDADTELAVLSSLSTRVLRDRITDMGIKVLVEYDSEPEENDRW